MDTFLLTNPCDVVVLLSEQNELTGVSTQTWPYQVTASCLSHTHADNPCASDSTHFDFYICGGMEENSIAFK